MYNKQHVLFSSNKSYLHNGQGSPNEFRKIYKPFDFIKSSLYHDNNFIFYNVNDNFLKIHGLQGYF
jgi:hypothetical protein